MITPAATTPLPASWIAQSADELATRPPRDVERLLATDRSRGLSAREAAARLHLVGPNDPAPVCRPSWPRVLARQLLNKLLVLLLLATAVTLLLGELLNAVAIGITVVIAAVFGFINEYRSERAIAALRRLTARQAEVIRDGLHENIPASALVPGDLLVLSEGDVVAADARLIESRGLRVNEAMLTGEPEVVAKVVDATPSPDAEAAPTMVYAGTTVAAGSGVAVVVATGRRTALGGIAAAVESAERRVTPLEARLDQLGNRLVLLFLALCALVVVIGLGRGIDATLVIMMALSLAIGAVPEGLPAVATTTLALAVRRLAAQGVLVRRLDAVETLGSTDVIVTDKTGTLTEGRMVVRSVLLADGARLDVAVEPARDGQLQTRFTKAGTTPSEEEQAVAAEVLRIAALCNDAVVEYDDAQGWHIHGDPSEGAIVLAATGLGLDRTTVQTQCPRLSTEPFSSATRIMRTTHTSPDGTLLTAIKGAYEQVATDAADASPALAREVHALGEAGFRIIAVAKALEGRAPCLLGAIVLEDPLRADAADAVAACRASGIRLVLVTGDHLATATTVARAIGLLDGPAAAVRGADLDLARLDEVAVVARATHAQKEQIVVALQACGAVVAMTGDGVNDAAALRAAHVGVAIGPDATDVAVEAAHIVVTDGRLRALVQGIREGRMITRNLRQSIAYLLTASFGTIFLITLSVALGHPLALDPLQILWLNLVVHVFPALALATSREASADTNQPTHTLLPDAIWLEIAWRSVTVAVAGVGALYIGAWREKGLAHEQTLVFLTLAFGLVGQAFLVGVHSARAQWARLKLWPVWDGVSISAGLLLLAIYLPALSSALGLVPADLVAVVSALGLAVLAAALAQLGAMLLRGHVLAA